MGAKRLGANTVSWRFGRGTHQSMADKVNNTARPSGAEGSARADGPATLDRPSGAAPGIKVLVAGMAAATAKLRAMLPRATLGASAGDGSAHATHADANRASPPPVPGMDTGSPTAALATTDNAEPVTDAAKPASAQPEYTSTLESGSGNPTSAQGADGANADAGKKGTAGLIGRLDADDRIRQTAERSERVLWAGAAAATLVYALLIAGQMAGLAILLPSEEVQRERERRGQGAPDSISVEIVPDPDHNSKTTRWREGTDVPAPQPMEQPPQPPQIEARAEPEPEPRPEPEPTETKPTEEKAEEPRDADSPMLLDIDSLVDAAAQDLKRQIDDHYDRKKQRQQQRRRQQAAASGAMQVRGTGASGRDDPFTRSVLAALMKTRPGPFALWGRVLVSFQIAESGQLLYVRVLQSSGNSALDEAAVDAIKRAQFKKPPPGLTPKDRTYIIDYIFG